MGLFPTNRLKVLKLFKLNAQSNLGHTPNLMRTNYGDSVFPFLYCVLYYTFKKIIRSKAKVYLQFQNGKIIIGSNWVGTRTQYILNYRGPIYGDSSL